MVDLSDIPAAKVDSPCVRNCCLDEQDICLGCNRTIEEIINWGNSTEDEKRTY